MSAQAPSVAFSTAVPLQRPLTVARRHPARVVALVTVLLWPLPLLAAAGAALVSGAAGAPLQIALAGFPPASHLLLDAPAPADWRAFAALVLIGVAAITTVVAAGLVGGAAADAATTRRALMSAILRWPIVVSVLFGQVLLLAAAVGLVLLAASLAGQLRFQLQTIVSVCGLGSLAVVAIRFSLWPAIASASGGSPFAANRESWQRSRDSVTRLVAGAAGLGAAVIAGAVGLRWTITLLLTKLDGAGHLALSPVGIDLVSLAPIVLASIAGAAAWGLAAPTLAESLGRWDRPDSGDAEQR